MKKKGRSAKSDRPAHRPAKPVVSSRRAVASALAAPTTTNIFGGPKPIPGYRPTPPAKPRPKGAPPPVIAKPKPKPVKQAPAQKGPKVVKKKIDFGSAKSVAAAAKDLSANADSKGYLVIGGRKIRVFSMKGIKIKRKPTKKAAVQPAAAAAAAALAKPARTKLNKRDLGAFRDLLLERRAELVGRVRGVEEDVLKANDGNLSNMPYHMADIGTDTFDQDFALGMAETDRALLGEIDEALTRIDDLTYGVCQQTGKPIPKSRLNAVPWTRYTVEAMRSVERARASRP